MYSIIYRLPPLPPTHPLLDDSMPGALEVEALVYVADTKSVAETMSVTDTMSVRQIQCLSVADGMYVR